MGKYSIIHVFYNNEFFLVSSSIKAKVILTGNTYYEVLMSFES